MKSFVSTSDKLAKQLNFLKTPLIKNLRLSEKFNANIFIKREDLQECRSFKIRGAYHKINNLSKKQKNKGISCASAGNHAQGVAYTCNKLKINGDIFLPENTPNQKIERIKYFASDYCNIHLHGDNFDQCLNKSLEFSNDKKKAFIHPYNDFDIILGQSTIASEIKYQIGTPDIIISSIGGGGLISGISNYFQDTCKIIGIEPKSCPSMFNSIYHNKIIYTKPCNNFVDGATVPIVGNIPFDICRKYVDEIYSTSNGKICEEILSLYKNDGIISEPAGALPFTVLDRVNIKNKTVVCILSGGNNDITRYPEIIDTYLRYKNLKHYFIIEFTQKPGELKKFVSNILGKKDDIVRFEYLKKTNKEVGKALIGIQSANIDVIYNNLKSHNFNFIKINDNDMLYHYLI